MAEPNPSVPKGSWIFITGATGYLGCYIVKIFLERGYKVRGAARNMPLAISIAEEVFPEYYKKGSLELVHVPDMTVKHAYDEHVKGMSIIVHCASILTFDPDPNVVIPGEVKPLLELLEAASRERSVQRFVHTDTVFAAILPAKDNPVHVEKDTWNEVALQVAQDARPPYNPAIGGLVYFAGKIKAAQALWDYVKEKKPDFVVNTVSPGFLWGTPLHKSHMRVGGTPLRALDFIHDKRDAFRVVTASVITDVRDAAITHVGAALDPAIQSERIQVWGQAYNWNDILVVLRKLYPEKKVPDDYPEMGTPLFTTDPSTAQALLKTWGDQDRPIGLEQCVGDTFEYALAWEASQK